MPVLSNARHERFAQAIAEGKTFIEAHEIAGFKPNDGNASKMASRPEIQDRVKEITGISAKNTGVTLEGLIEEAAEIQERAIADDQFSAAVAALTAKAKLAGLWIERGEHANTNVNYAVGEQPMTEEEWADQRVTEH